MDMKEVRELIREHLTDDLDETAVNVFRSVSGRRRADYLLAFIREEARRIHRARARGVERRNAYAVTALPDGASRTVIDALADLAKSTFALPDGSGLVRWGEATPAQHRARAAWCRRLAGALIEDAELHEAAAVAIEEAGVACLDDLIDRAADDLAEADMEAVA
jgi:hypothetical protein